MLLGPDKGSLITIYTDLSGFREKGSLSLIPHEVRCLSGTRSLLSLCDNLYCIMDSSVALLQIQLTI